MATDKQVKYVQSLQSQYYDSAKEAALSVGLKNSGALYASFKNSSKSAGKDKKGNKLYWIKKEDLCNKYIDNNTNEWYT